jgi:hypothetical protein
MNPDAPFGFLGPTAEELNDANKAHAIAYGALTIALIDKGLITEEEYKRAFAQATVIIDQEFARKRDQQQEGS